MTEHKPNSADRLVEAFETDGATIRLERGNVFDLTGFTLPNLPNDGRLVSGNDSDDGPTATLLYNGRVDDAVLKCRGDFHWEGVEFVGAEHDRVPLDRSTETIGLWLFGEEATIKRAAFHGFPVANVQVGAVNPWRETEATLANVRSTHSLMDGYGYGAELINGRMEADGVEMDWCRHAVASSGRPSASYHVHHSWFGQHTLSHVLDVHGRERDDGPPVAGGETRIHHNTIEATHDLDGKPQEAVKFRGVPANGGAVYSNRFAHSEPPDEPGSEGEAIYQEFVDEWTRVVEFDNVYGATP